MSSAMDYAMFFIKSSLIEDPNTESGNMKLQKLLTFSNLVSLAKYGRPFFTEPILAYQNGCVVESIRLRYKKDYSSFEQDSYAFAPKFTDEEYDILNTVKRIFGHLSAKQLSELNHTFAFWKKAYDKSLQENGYHDKRMAVIQSADVEKELDKFRQVLAADELVQKTCRQYEVVNGVTFSYDPSNITLSEEVISSLEEFTYSCTESNYVVILENGELIIY